jgi:hypothetical protein
MKTTVAVVVLLFLVASVRAEETQTAPEPREQFTAAAKSVAMRSDARAVESTLANLGKPKVSFKWCNRSGCVDHRDEVGSNRMYVSYSRSAGNKLYLLNVMFCTESSGAWQVAMVTASENATKLGAFGTQGKSENLYQDMDTRVPGCMAR